MARSLVCRQRGAEASHAGAQGCGGTVAGPTSVPRRSGTPILNGTNVVCGRKEGFSTVREQAEQAWIRGNDRVLTCPIDEQTGETRREGVTVVCRA